MAKPPTRNQLIAHRRFIERLAETGNVRAAARELGLNRATLTRRRAADAAFATEWDAALVAAHARMIDTTGQASGPVARLTRRADGRVQLRRPGTRRPVTHEHEQRFFAALSASANVMLSAAAAGISAATVYERRKKNPAFAREMRLALQTGYDRLEDALLASWAPDNAADDAWRHNDPPAMPPMSPAQALQLMYLHQKEARLLAEPPHLKRRRGESSEAHSFRLSVMYEKRRQIGREMFAIGQAMRAAAGVPLSPAGSTIVLPDLTQLTGWSRADEPVNLYDQRPTVVGRWGATGWRKRGL